jgi:hypothetical protein
MGSARARQQQRAQARHAARAAHPHPLEAELGKQPPERAPRVEVQVVGERLAVALESAHQHVQAAMRGRSDQQGPPRRQHPPQLADEARRVGDVLDHLARADELEASVRERQRALRRGAMQLDARAARPRPLKRGFGDIDANRPSAGERDCRGQLASAAADIQHALAGAHMRKEKVAAQL